MKPEDEVVFSGSPEAVRKESARRTRRAFLAGGITAAAGAAAAYYLDHTPTVDELQSGLRRVENTNAAIARTVFQERGLAPTYPHSRAIPLRLNGTVGLGDDLELSSYRLQIAGADAGASPFFVNDVTAWDYQYKDTGSQQDPGTDSKAPPKAKPTNTLNPGGLTDSKAAQDVTAKFEALAKPKQGKRNVGSDEAGPSRSSLDIGTPGYLLPLDYLTKTFPQVDFVTEFKCVEGWSNITHWTGIRLRDLLDAFPPKGDPKYLYMETPDGNYYAGFDLAAARHPQSLLVTHMHGAPLAQEHGAPLRLHMPIKYGYKQLKRIGVIAYSFTKPDDYWEKLGYDWYAGL